MDYPNRFLTIYRKDYVKKCTRPIRSKGGVPQEFRDPVGNPFINYLTLHADEAPPPFQEVESYTEGHSKRHPKHGELYFSKPYRKEFLRTYLAENGRSIYMMDYCDLLKDLEYKEQQRIKNAFRLPEDVQIPLSTQRYSYRNPASIMTALGNDKATPAESSLDPNPRVRALLKITTGLTEYGGVIGDLGKLILDDQYYGKMVREDCPLISED